ncbi:hypothetical protein C7M84_016491 [Penaeus vannamei]|uniref:Uncharacterized protein n=1 Tax=Penaeus vannamei TaxID=6689 RepID=A0A423SN01_PENVA|nr:hypothetical protein C7M84_016491 [Penaeus vannamei]
MHIARCLPTREKYTIPDVCERILLLADPAHYSPLPSHTASGALSLPVDGTMSESRYRARFSPFSAVIFFSASSFTLLSSSDDPLISPYPFFIPFSFPSFKVPAFPAYLFFFSLLLLSASLFFLLSLFDDSEVPVFPAIFLLLLSCFLFLLLPSSDDRRTIPSSFLFFPFFPSFLPSKLPASPAIFFFFFFFFFLFPASSSLLPSSPFPHSLLYPFPFLPSSTPLFPPSLFPSSSFSPLSSSLPSIFYFSFPPSSSTFLLFSSLFLSQTPQNPSNPSSLHLPSIFFFSFPPSLFPLLLLFLLFITLFLPSSLPNSQKPVISAFLLALLARTRPARLPSSQNRLRLLRPLSAPQGMGVLEGGDATLGLLERGLKAGFFPPSSVGFSFDCVRGA